MSRSKTKKILVVRKQVVSRKSKKSSKSTKSRRRARKGPSRTAATPAGVAFQKCTLAPADFQDSGFAGIPDEFDGQVISKKHTLVNSLPSYTTGHDLYIVQMPIPGVAYFFGDRTAGSTTAITLNAVFYDDAATLFPVGAEDTNISAFRQASNVIEFVPTVNEMSWGGSIEVWKSKVVLAEAPGTAATTGYSEIKLLAGLSESMNTKKACSVFALRDGCYCPAFNTEANYEWTKPEIALSFTALTTTQNQGPSIDSVISFSGSTASFIGLGSFETTIIKFPAIIASQTGMLRAWSCVEYQVSPTSILYDYSHMSPSYDPVALAMVKAYHKASPCAVAWKDNASFWENFKKVAGIGAEIMSYLPGPVGAIGKIGRSLFPSSYFG